MTRFSKEALTVELQKAIDALQTDWGFDIDNGTVQIERVALDRIITNPIDFGGGARDKAYHLREATLDYGRLQALQALATTFSLAVSYVPVTHQTRRKLGRFPYCVRVVSDAQAQAALDHARAKRGQL